MGERGEEMEDLGDRMECCLVAASSGLDATLCCRDGLELGLVAAVVLYPQKKI